jgi:hypothetical protein
MPDDFGCVVAGRWLRGISILADSAVMALPVGAEMETEVGASISIPGAADMHSTIEALPDSKKLTIVAISRRRGGSRASDEGGQPH